MDYLNGATRARGPSQTVAFSTAYEISLRELPPTRGRRVALPFTGNTALRRRNCWNVPLRAALLFAVGLTGCDNACFIFTSNPPNGTIGIKASDPIPTCRLTKVNGAVRVEAHTVPVCSSCPESGRVHHMFVTIRGIAVHPSAMADDDSPDWEELLPPNFVKQPLQVDLVRGTADQRAREPLGQIAAIPAGIYRQVRLRFATNELTTDDRIPEKDTCGSTAFNCVVMADGRVQPLLINGSSPELRITSDRIEGASLFIPPDTDTNLIIELTPVWAWFSSADEGVRLRPALTGSAKVGRVAFDTSGAPEHEVVHDSH